MHIIDKTSQINNPKCIYTGFKVKTIVTTYRIHFLNTAYSLKFPQKMKSSDYCIEFHYLFKILQLKGQ